MTVGGWRLPSPGFGTLLGTPREGLQPLPQAGMAPLYWHLLAGLVGSPLGTGFSGYQRAKQQGHLPDSPGMGNPWSGHPHPSAPSVPWVHTPLCHWLSWHHTPHARELFEPKHNKPALIVFPASCSGHEGNCLMLIPLFNPAAS